MRCFQAPPAPVLIADALRTDTKRPASRNPILLSQPEDEPPQPRFSKARIAAGDSSQARYLAERPRGLAKGQFSSASQGTFDIGKEAQLEFTPGRKVIEVPADRQEKVTRKKQLQAHETTNPILQTEARYEPEPIRQRTTQDWRPSSVTEYTSQRQYLLPAELGKSRGEFYDKRNRSSVFSDGSEDSSRSYRKRPDSRQDEAPAVLQYKYALPYRDTPISEKPQRLNPTNA